MTPQQLQENSEMVTMFVRNFADAVSRHEFTAAKGWAALAQGRWEDAYSETMKERAKQQGIPWPLPGSPDADDVTGWTGWYGGGYGGVLA